MAEETKKQDTKKTSGKIEREYTIPLREKLRVVPRYKKSNKAIKTIKEFLARHMKVRDRDLNKIKIDRYLNEFVWSNGIKNPPVKIRVKAMKDEDSDIVIAELSEMPEKLKFKKAREEKRDKKSVEDASKKKVPEKESEEKTETEKVEEEKKTAEEKEKKAAIVEAGKEMEKMAAKQAKHKIGGKTKQPKHQTRKALAK